MYLFYDGVIIIPARHTDMSRIGRREQTKRENKSGRRSYRSNLQIKERNIIS